MGKLVLKNLRIRYGRATVIENVDLVVEDGEVVSLLGPSGSGKTTILRAIAGLLKPDRGTIRIDGRDVGRLPPEKRDAVMVFQNPLLFPFMNVAQNIAFGIRMAGASNAAAQNRRVGEMMALTGLQGLERRKVHELSSGQQQRVSLARALILRPAVLLLDEPLSSLDANLRLQMRELLKDIQERTGTTMVFVTHDQSEALVLGHRVALLLDGRIRQIGPPRSLFHEPASPVVARFFGGVNFFPGTVENGVFRSDVVRAPVKTAGDGKRSATIRPEDVRVSTRNGRGNGLEGQLIRVRFEGTVSRLWVRCRGKEWVALSPDVDFTPGRPVYLELPPEKVHVFPDSGEDLSTERKPTAVGN